MKEENTERMHGSSPMQRTLHLGEEDRAGTGILLVLDPFSKGINTILVIYIKEVLDAEHSPF